MNKKHKITLIHQRMKNTLPILQGLLAGGVVKREKAVDLAMEMMHELHTKTADLLDKTYPANPRKPTSNTLPEAQK